MMDVRRTDNSVARDKITSGMALIVRLDVMITCIIELNPVAVGMWDKESL